MPSSDEAPQRQVYEPSGNAEFPPPDLGRTVRVVGTVVNVDPEETPHPRVRRGEVGKPLFNYARNFTSAEPLLRISSPRARDRQNVFMFQLQQAPRGAANPHCTPVPDPAAMTRHIKRVGRALGADIVGVGRSHPSFVYGGGALHAVGFITTRADGTESPDELCRRYPYVIVAPVAWDYSMGQAHRHHIGDAAYEFNGAKIAYILAQLEGYIRELGYSVVRGKVNPQAAALAAGVGELGRNGLIITEQFGARVHLSDALMTDLPLTPSDTPLDIGVEDYCKVCRKCAESCPTNSIPFGPKQVYNGVEKFKINWETCYKLRPLVTEHWSICLTCATVCPYTRPDTRWRSLAMRGLRATPIALRPLVVRALKWLDDRRWGTMTSTRVRWLGYDSGVKPGVTACAVGGCSAAHGEAPQQDDAPRGDIGYYAPMKQNVNRFVKR